MPNDEEQPQVQNDAVTPVQPAALPLGQHVATNLEERPVTAAPHDELEAADAQSLAQAYVVQPKSRKRTFIVMDSILGVALVAAMAFGAYYYLFRLQDSDYQTALDPVDAMVADISKTHALGGKSISITTASFTTAASSPSPTPSLTPEQISSARKNTDDYGAKLDLLKKLPVVSKDAAVKQAFSDSSAAFVAYRDTEGQIIDTTDTFSTLIAKYVTFYEKINTYKNSDTFDLGAAPVRDYLDAHTTVPLKDFNSRIYVPYRQDILDYFTASDDLFTSIETKDKTLYQSALVSLNDVKGRLDRLKPTMKTYKLPMAANPTHQLTDLRQTIANRKAVFFR